MGTGASAYDLLDLCLERGGAQRHLGLSLAQVDAPRAAPEALRVESACICADADARHFCRDAEQAGQHRPSLPVQEGRSRRAYTPEADRPRVPDAHPRPQPHGPGPGAHRAPPRRDCTHRGEYGLASPRDNRVVPIWCCGAPDTKRTWATWMLATFRGSPVSRPLAGAVGRTFSRQESWKRSPRLHGQASRLSLSARSSFAMLTYQPLKGILEPSAIWKRFGGLRIYTAKSGKGWVKST